MADKKTFEAPVKKHPLVKWDLTQEEVDEIQRLNPSRDFSILGLRRNPETGRAEVSSAVVGGEVLLNFPAWNFPKLQRRYSREEMNEMARRMCDASHWPRTESFLRSALSNFEMDLPD